MRVSNHVSVVVIYQILVVNCHYIFWWLQFLNGIVIAIVRPYLALGTTCVARRPDPMSPNTAQARAGGPKHARNCALSLSSSNGRGPWGVFLGFPIEGQKPCSEFDVKCPWRPGLICLGFWDDFRHFFGLFPSVHIVTPKMPGVVIIKGPLTARKKKYMSPGAWFWPFLAFLAYCGSRPVPITGKW